MELVVSLIINRIFDENSRLVNNTDDIDNFLIQLINLVKIACFNKCKAYLSNSIFSMILNLVKAKLQSNVSKYLDICILNDLADCLTNFIGKSNQINQVITWFDFKEINFKYRSFSKYFNMIIAQALIYEIEINYIKPSAGKEIITLNIDKSSNSNEYT